MTVTCESCVFFRRPKPPSQLLARAVGVSEGPVANALAKIVEDEQKYLDAESTQKRGRANSTDDSWPLRPVMSAYCVAPRHGAGAEGERWLIPEIHNRGGLCQDWVTRSESRQACRDCVHRRVATGPARDEHHEATYAHMIEEGTTSQARTSSSDEALLTRHREGIAARKALEVTGAHASRGVLLVEPQYLDWCEALSRPEDEEWVVCALQNPHASCPAWEPSPGPDAAGPAAEASVTHSDEALVTMLCWLLELNLSGPTLAEARQLAADLAATDARTWQFVTQVCRPLYDQAPAVHEALADFRREQVEPGLVAALRAGGSSLGSLLVGEYDRVNAPLAGGDPPLTAEVADAFIDVLTFLDGLVTGWEAARATDADRAVWRDRMALAWPSLHPDARAWVARMPLSWAELRYQWATTPVEQRWQLAQHLQTGLGVPARGVATQITTMPLPARPVAQPATAPGTFQAGIVRGPGSGPPAWVGAEPSGPSEEALLREITAGHQDEEEQLLQEQPELALQVKLHNRMQRAALISNMMNMQHETCMSIIKNIK
jgi:hypothetical protein